MNKLIERLMIFIDSLNEKQAEKFFYIFLVVLFFIPIIILIYMLYGQILLSN
jgi:hypothetical protein